MQDFEICMPKCVVSGPSIWAWCLIQHWAGLIRFHVHVRKCLITYLHLINHHRHVLPPYLIKLLMDLLVMSNMEYALSVWDPSLTQNQVLHLQRLQIHVVRLVFSRSRSDHVSKYYQKLSWLRVGQLIQFRLAWCTINIMQPEESCLCYLAIILYTL